MPFTIVFVCWQRHVIESDSTIGLVAWLMILFTFMLLSSRRLGNLDWMNVFHHTFKEGKNIPISL
jgi:hypothetical protein